jgi:hypothetical protein
MGSDVRQGYVGRNDLYISNESSWVPMLEFTQQALVVGAELEISFLNKVVYRLP